MKLNGLTTEEVKARIAEGKVNRSPKKQRNTITKIILKNTLTIFNLVNLILAIMIIIVGSYKNLLFIFIAIANTLISIINEIRAKRTIDKLKLISGSFIVAGTCKATVTAVGADSQLAKI